MALVTLRCFPVNDHAFASAVDGLVRAHRAGGGLLPDPADVQRRLRAQYPGAVVSARQPLARRGNESEILWYVFRDGSVAEQPRLVRRILVVDDDEAFALMLEAMLTSAGFEVRWARDGDDGLEEASRFGPSLILLDLGMPRTSGEEFAELYRAMEPPKAQIVVVSGLPDAWRRAQSIEARAVIKKPFEMAPFLELVRHLA